MRTEIKARIGQEKERPFFGMTTSTLWAIVGSIAVGIIVGAMFFFLPFLIRSLFGLVACSTSLYFSLKSFHGIPGLKYLWLSYKFAKKQKVYLYRVDRNTTQRTQRKRVR